MNKERYPGKSEVAIHSCARKKVNEEKAKSRVNLGFLFSFTRRLSQLTRLFQY